MGLQFTDANGYEGTINDSLTMDYHGTWEAGVKEYIAIVETDVSDEDRDFREPNAMSHPVFELPGVAPIVEVERERAHSESTPLHLSMVRSDVHSPALPTSLKAKQRQAGGPRIPFLYLLCYVSSAANNPDEIRKTASITPTNRLDEARKQLTIANEKAETDIEKDLQKASEALESARANLASGN